MKMLRTAMISCKERMWIDVHGGLVVSAVPGKAPSKAVLEARKARFDEWLSKGAIQAEYPSGTPGEHDLEAQAVGMRQWALRVKFARGRFVSANIGIFWVILALCGLVWLVNFLIF